MFFQSFFFSLRFYFYNSQSSSSSSISMFKMTNLYRTSSKEEISSVWQWWSVCMLSPLITLYMSEKMNAHVELQETRALQMVSYYCILPLCESSVFYSTRALDITLKKKYLHLAVSSILFNLEAKFCILYLFWIRTEFIKAVWPWTEDSNHNHRDGSQDVHLHHCVQLSVCISFFFI